MQYVPFSFLRLLFVLTLRITWYNSEKVLLLTFTEFNHGNAATITILHRWSTPKTEETGVAVKKRRREGERGFLKIETL